MAPEIRVALVDLPPLLREIVSGALMGASDVDIVDYYADRKALMQALPIAHVDAVVIAPSQSERDEIARELLSAAPYLAVLSLSRDDRDVIVSQLTFRSSTVHDVSAAALIEAIRSSIPSYGCDA